MNKQEIQDMGKQLLFSHSCPCQSQGVDICSSGSTSSAAPTSKGTCFLLNGRLGGARQGEDNEEKEKGEEKGNKVLLAPQNADSFWDVGEG